MLPKAKALNEFLVSVIHEKLSGLPLGSLAKQSEALFLASEMLEPLLGFLSFTPDLDVDLL